MDPTTDPAATAASVAASVVAGSPSNNNNTGLSDDAAAFSLTLSKDPPDVAFDRLCKVHQGAGLQQECQVCRRLFPNWYKLKQHLHTHADFRPYTCTYCDKTFRNYSKKSRHEKTHSGIKPYVCKICDKHVSRSEHLKRHLLTHTESHPFKCLHCEYRSRRLDCIRYHMKNKHPEKESPKIMLNQNIVDADGDHPNDASDILWQQYKDSPDTLALVTVRSSPEESGPKPKKKKKKKSLESASFPFPENKTPQYPASTTNMLGQQINFAQFPSTLPPSMIPGFSGFTSLNHNIKNEPPAGTPPNSQANTSQQNQAEPTASSNGQQQLLQQKMLDTNFTSGDENCTNRSKFFLNQITQPSLITTPQQSNLELPKNMCGICEKAFDCPSKLQRHQNTHAGIRPYKCNVCGKSLSRPEHLKRHLQTHDPDKQKSPPFSKSTKSKAKANKSTVSTTGQAILSQATLAQAQALQQQNQDAAVVVSRVKQEADDPQQVLTCQVVQQKTPPLTVVAAPTLNPESERSSQPPPQPQYIMAATASQQQLQHQQHPLLQVAPSGTQASMWSPVAVGGTATQAITINATNGLPAGAGIRALEPQLVGTTYAPGGPVAVLHGYTIGAAPVSTPPTTSSTSGISTSSGSGGQPAAVMYQRAPIPTNLIVNATVGNPSTVCGPPVFPPIS